MKKKILAAAVGAMLVGGAASAAVTVSQGGKGDVLIAPTFMTGGGWQTELKVVNTSSTKAAVAKVVFHEPSLSGEVLDFLIFLTPGDVWVGSVQQNADGTVGVTSSDDSSLKLAVSNGNLCPDVSGITKDGQDITPITGFTSDVYKFTQPVTIGYVNILETRTFSLSGRADFAEGSPFSKATLARMYASACSTPLAITANDTDNILSGVVKLNNPGSGNMLALPMTAIANYKNASYHGVGAYTGFFNNTSHSGATWLDAKKAVEEALWSSDYVVPFNNATGQATMALVTFPTKEAFTTSLYKMNASSYAPFYNGAALATPKLNYVVRDESENSFTSTCYVSPCVPSTVSGILPNELNVLSVVNTLADSANMVIGTKGGSNGASFTKGWVNLNPAPALSPINQVSGSPALVTYIQWNAVGGGIQGAWNYAASTK